MLGGGNDKLYGILCDRLGHPEWKTDPRFESNNMRVKNREAVDGVIEQETMKRTTQEWLEILEGSGMPYSAINDIQGTLNHSHGKSSSRCVLLYIYIYIKLPTSPLTLNCSPRTRDGSGGRASRVWSNQTRQYPHQIL